MAGIVDIIIPHLNNEDFITGLASIKRNTPEGVINRVILIDQCMNVHNLTSLVHTVVRCENQGFARAMNLGIRLSDAPYVMCLNDDVVFFNKQWWEGIMSTFRDIPNALCVNPSSVCNPDGAGGKTILDGYSYKEDYSDEEYNKLINPHVIDTICMWGPVFRRELLDKLPGNIPGKAWFDERFYPGGSEDYDMNRRAYLAGMRCVGTGRSWAWHWWHGTKRTDGTLGAHWSSGFDEKWTSDDGERPDLFGNKGRKEVPLNILR